MALDLTWGEGKGRYTGFGFMTTGRRGLRLRKDSDYISDIFSLRYLETFKLCNQRGSWISVPGDLG